MQKAFVDGGALHTDWLGAFESRLQRQELDGPKARPGEARETECPEHPGAMRCFHRGESWMAEYRFANGRWRLDVECAGYGHVSITHQRWPTVAYADAEWEANQAWVREYGR